MRCGSAEGARPVRTSTRLSVRPLRHQALDHIPRHPGEADDALVKRSGYARERPTELATLTDPRVRAAVSDLHITLATFADV